MRIELEKILSFHGVLTHDGWQFVTEELIQDLLKWAKTNEKDYNGKK